MWRHWSLIAGVAASTLGVAETSAQAPPGLDKLKHILVIYLENHSFDSLFGEFEGANGIDSPGGKVKQQKVQGGHAAHEPFSHGLAASVTSPVHKFYTNRAQINGGKNDLFATYGRREAMGHYSREAMTGTALWTLAREHRLLDNFFQGAFGGSFLNHQWLICACAPKWPNAPANLRSVLENGRPELDAEGHTRGDRTLSAAKESELTPKKGAIYAVNTVQSKLFNDGQPGKRRLPAQDGPTIGHQLDAKGVKWAWYAGDWELAGKVPRTPQDNKELHDRDFQWHHHPFPYYKRYKPGSEGAKEHLRNAEQLNADINNGTLPPVAFYKPASKNDQHPGYAELKPGDDEVGRVVKLVQDKLKGYAVIITYDENGGFYDHVPPPGPPGAPGVGKRADYFGPGTRIPAILVSPFARKGIDSTEFDTTSILKLIIEWQGLEALESPRLQAVNSLSKAFDFQQ
jgi:acid phosphatase